ncbi:MAG: hypothetical protein ACLFS3_02025 [Candidatus Aenigmatarchaeota archaeon]
MVALSTILSRGTLFYIGWAFIPTPPSPVPDFGLQFLFSLIIGLIAPKILVKPVNIFATYLGRFVRGLFIHFPLLGRIVKWVDEALKNWKEFAKKERYSDRPIVNKFYMVFGRSDIIERLIFGYFCSIVLGIFLIVISLLI